MNGVLPLRVFRHSFQKTLTEVRSSRFFSDRLSLVLFFGALIANGANVLYLVLRLKPVDIPVPTRFSSLGGFDVLGHWYYPFLIALFALGVTLVNGWIAYHSFPRSRLASFFLLAGSCVTAIFSFIISSAFGIVGSLQ